MPEPPSQALPQPVDFAAPTSQGSLDVRWRHGVRRGSGHSEPKIQVHRYDEHTFVLRQAKTVSYEAPFLYLLFGNARALLLDTGAGQESSRCPVRATVDHLVETWLAAHPRPSYGLVVAHSHRHRDHVAGDAQFEGRPDTTVVGSDRCSVLGFFGFTSWPEEVLTLDLGGRVLQITGTPGHDDSSISVLDRWSGFLMTGDLVYPGRLYVQDMAAFTDSLQRVLALAAAGQVRYVMGAHIEMSRTPGRDYPLGTRYQPDEPALQMSIEQLARVRDAAVSVADSPGTHVLDDFVIFNGPCRLAMAHQRVRRAWGYLCRR
jgi:hydroxyacylglutathione hydrolase